MNKFHRPLHSNMRTDLDDGKVARAQFPSELVGLLDIVLFTVVNE